jgi:hypothetical protein
MLLFIGGAGTALYYSQNQPSDGGYSAIPAGGTTGYQDEPMKTIPGSTEPSL